MVDRGLISQISDEIVPVTLFTCIDRQENLFLWPAKIPSPDGRKCEWHTSAIKIAHLAMKKWVRIISNTDQGYYEPKVARDEIPEPHWPEITFTEILKIAFKDRLLTNINHSVLKQLRGEL